MVTPKDSYFNKYVFEFFVKVQLLFDDEFRTRKVCDLQSIPRQPKISTKKLHLDFGNRDEALNRQFVDELKNIQIYKELDLNPSTVKYLSQFYDKYSKELRHWDVITILDSFDKFIAQTSLSEPELYYVSRIQLIDMLLLCKASDSQRSKLLTRRSKVHNESYTVAPDIRNLKYREALVRAFQVTNEQLDNKIKELRPSLAKSDVAYFINSDKSLVNKYTRQDFASDSSYKNWKDRITYMNQELTKKFKSQSSKSKSTSYVPNDLIQVLLYLKDLVYDSSPIFFDQFVRCLQIWQVDPFDMYIHMVEDIPERKPDLEYATKCYGLAKLSMVVRMDLEEWPVQKRETLLRLNRQVYFEYKSLLSECFLNFFADKRSFTSALELSRFILVDEIEALVLSGLRTALSTRLNKHFKELKLSQNKSKIEFIANLLAYVNLDFDEIEDWTQRNIDLDQGIEFMKIAIEYLTRPIEDYLKAFIMGLKTSSKDGTASQANSNLTTLLELLSKLRKRTNMNVSFQSILFPNVLELVNSWGSEITEQTERAIENDDLDRLEGCSYSSSVQNVLQICNAYIKILRSFEWENEHESAQMFANLYRSISETLNSYSNTMFVRIEKELNSGQLLNFKGESCTCLNNIFKVLDYMDQFKTDELTKYSKILSARPVRGSKYKKKVVLVDIKGAENVEDNRGQPLSLYVLISGVISGRTRCIFKDYNPEWNEKFQTSTDKESGFLRFDLIEKSGILYKSLTHKLRFKDNYGIPMDEKLSLSPNSGRLNICVQIIVEKNDPLFYVDQAKLEIRKGRDRSIKLFVDRFSEETKDIFTKSFLEESLRRTPATPFVMNHKALKEPELDSYIDQMQLHTIQELYDNMETECFDAVIAQLWIKILKEAENLILPRISFLFYKVESRLNKRTSAINGIMPSSRYRKTDDIEFTRVMEWCLKFKDMFHAPGKILDDQINNIYDDFMTIFKLFQLSIADLKTEYNRTWTQLNKYVVKKYVREKNEMEADPTARKLLQTKEILLRILIAKNELRFAKAAIEIEQRYERAIKTEMECYYMSHSSPGQLDLV
ncbi:hypothetical protein OGAPHI_004554 [Ogataea philodendri]|uniref:MHD1 domain-containing protein n=1 Tax=Ogataea philodendri TaxID=1378263 RepID=A0A9P8T2V1_9ASCO|nr:uncharacterized protein OGAPHI_004554 [Ogataea philodendri]KAH3664203.1 hypothetical protein OGAPHI_004554 [Ogataea philodendri]